MRNMNCRNVRREIEEADPGEALSVGVNTHLENCAACQTLSRQQSKLQAIVSSLGTVEAPGDFDFRLRARLAGERNGSARPLALGDFSFGFRSASIAMVLLVIGAAFVFVSFRTRQGNPATADGLQAVAKPGTTLPGAAPIKAGDDGKPGDSRVAVEPKQSDPLEGSLGLDGQVTPKRRFVKSGLAAARGGNVTTQDQSSTPANVLKAYDEALNTYPTAAFPIDASYQSLKMSVDDGRGSSRTISLPTVSFGSQRGLSQNASPLMASARGVW